MAKLFFKNTSCPHCGQEYDPTFHRCPKCGNLNADPDAETFQNYLPLPLWKQLVYAGIGLFGLQILAFFAQLIVLAMKVPSDPLGYLTSGEGLFAVYSIVYPALFLIMAILTWKGWLSIGKSLASWKPYLAGLIGVAFMIGAGSLYNLIIQAIFQAAGAPLPEVNGNQANVISMVLANPIACVFIIGFLGPFSEELAYRAGLFGFASRLGKKWGYVIGIVVFAFIHFDVTALGSGSAFLAEAIALPTYLGSAAVLCFLYDRFGFGASYTAHVLNNLISILEIIVIYGGSK